MFSCCFVVVVVVVVVVVDDVDVDVDVDVVIVFVLLLLLLLSLFDCASLKRMSGISCCEKRFGYCFSLRKKLPLNCK